MEHKKMARDRRKPEGTRIYRPTKDLVLPEGQQQTVLI